MSSGISFAGFPRFLRFLQLPFGLVPELIVPSGGSVPRVREHVVGSDLLFGLSIVRFLQAQPALGGLWGEKGRGCAGRNCGYDPISQFEPATLVPKRKTRLARQAASG